MIARDAEPVDHRPPYKPLDVRGRKPSPPPAEPEMPLHAIGRFDQDGIWRTEHD